MKVSSQWFRGSSAFAVDLLQLRRSNYFQAVYNPCLIDSLPLTGTYSCADVMRCPEFTVCPYSTLAWWWNPCVTNSHKVLGFHFQQKRHGENRSCLLMLERVALLGETSICVYRDWSSMVPKKVALTLDWKCPAWAWMRARLLCDVRCIMWLPRNRLL